jgi:membrane-associated phospholipid phosphatase
MIRCLNATDALIGLFILVLSCVAILFAARVPYWRVSILVNLGALGYIFLLALLRRRTGCALVRWLHDWNAIPLLIFCYKEVYFLIQPIYRGRVFDGLLIELDRWLFGTDPTVWLEQFRNPYLTEILQLAYSFFYLFFLIIGFEIYRRRNVEQFSRLRFAIAYGLILSYIGYLLLPAVGPRFTLHDYARTDDELPGLVLTPYLRWFVNAGESIPAGASDSVALAVAQRDAFPSGHTMMTLVLIFLGFKWRTRSRFFILIVGSLLIVATVYLRYHYVVDILAGALWAGFCLRTTHALCLLVRTRLRLDS